MHLIRFRVRGKAALIKFTKTNMQNIHLSNWRADLDSVRAKISRLGAINLAAPDEIDAETKRKEELDLQYNDLTDALEKLNQSFLKLIRKRKKNLFKALMQLMPDYRKCFRSFLVVVVQSYS